MRGQTVALSSLVTISDPDGVGYQKLELWDSAGTVGGGQFVVNGTPQTGGHEIDVAPANVGSTMFDVGTLGGTDTLWAQLLQNNGQVTGWQQFTVTAPATRLPTLSVSSDGSATRGQTLALSTLVTISDPDGVGYQKLELWDSAGTAGWWAVRRQGHAAERRARDRRGAGQRRQHGVRCRHAEPAPICCGRGCCRPTAR